MSRLKIYCILWVLFWFSLIGYVLWVNGANAQTGDPVLSAPTMDATSPAILAFYSNKIRFTEPSKDIWERPLVGSDPKQKFYGCMLSLWEVDDAGTKIGGNILIALSPSSPQGGGVLLVTIPIQFEGKLIRANGYCANGYGFGPKSTIASYFVKK